MYVGDGDVMSDGEPVCSEDSYSDNWVSVISFIILKQLTCTLLSDNYKTIQD